MRTLVEVAKPLLLVTCALLGIVYFAVQLFRMAQAEPPATLASQASPVGQAKVLAGSSADVPAILRKAKEDRDAELKLVHLELSHVSEELINLIAAFEGEINEWGIEYHLYRQYSPRMAALGQQLREPQRVVTNKHVSAIRGTGMKLVQAKRQYDLQVERIKIAYSQRLASVELPQGQRPPVEDPKTEFEPRVAFAFWLTDRLDTVLQSMIQRILLFNEHSNDPAPIQPKSTLANWKLEYEKSRGEAPDSSQFEKDRAAALQMLESTITKLEELTDDKDARKFAEESQQIAEQLRQAKALIEQEKFEEATDVLTKAESAMQHAKSDAARRNATAQFEAELSKTPMSLWESDGGEPYQRICQFVAKARKSPNVEEAVASYDEAKTLAQEQHRVVRLTAATRFEAAGNLEEAIRYVGQVCTTHQNDATAKSTFERLMRKKPDYVLEMADECLPKITDKEDSVVSSQLLLIAHEKLKVKASQKIVDVARESSKRLFQESYTDRHWMIWWGICDFMVDERLSENFCAPYLRRAVEDIEARVTKSSDPMRLLDWLAVYNGLAERRGLSDIVSECSRIYPTICQAYFKRDLSNDRASQALLDAHYRAYSLFVAGHYNAAFAIAKATGHAYTWACFVRACAFDAHAASKLKLIAEHYESHRREVRSWSRVGLMGSSEFSAIEKEQAALLAPEGRVYYDYGQDFDSDIVFQVLATHEKDSRPARFHDNHVGLFAITQCNFTRTAIHNKTTNPIDSMFEIRKWNDASHRLGRLTGLALALNPPEPSQHANLITSE